MTVIAEGTSVTETSSPPPRKKFCLSLSGRGRSSQTALPLAVNTTDLSSTMSITVNGTKNGGVKRGVGVRSATGNQRRDAMTGPLETNIMLNGYVSESVNSIPASDDSPSSDAPPVATLCNLGNTCFLNSILYTLRFAPAFLHNLHHLVTDLADLAARQNSIKAKSSSLGRSVGVGNKYWSNDKVAVQGTQDTFSKSRIQLATERLHEVYEALHSAELKDSSEPFQPDVFLHALREVNPMFEGNQQHDAHELLGCLLNYIRDTCTDLAKQLEAQPHLSSNMTNGVSNHEEAKKETKGSLLASVVLSSSTSSISSVKWGVRKSWKRKKTPDTNVIRSNSTSKNVASSVIENNSNSGEHHIGNGEPATLPESPVIESRALVNGEAAPEPGEGDTESRVNGSCTLGTLPEEERENLNGASHQAGLNFIADDFEGVMVLCTTCLECECMTEMKETFFEIGVPIQTEQDPDIGDNPDKVSELYRASIVTEELLLNVNKYWCEHCLRYNEARRSVRYQTLPRLLTLQLKRFSSTFGSMVCMSKVNDYMPTPLTLECFCEQCLHPQGNSAPTKHSYQLYGVIMHLGATIASGHYVAYVRASDPTPDYRSCDRDKRKTGSLLANGASKTSSATDGDKTRGILRFFSKHKSNASDAVSKNQLANPYYGNTCRSFDCCGVRVNRSLTSTTLVNGCVNEEVEASEPSWLECDDETVRVLSKKQLEEVLAPKQAKSSALTPYLLFYARDP